MATGRFRLRRSGSWGGRPTARGAGRHLVVLCAVAVIVSGRPRSDAPEPQGREGPKDTRVEAPLVHVRDVVASRLFVGHRVRVAGTCLAHGIPGDTGVQRVWQIADEGAVVAVVGPIPTACRLGARVVVEGLVVEDVLPSLGQLPAARRRYLRVGRHEPMPRVPRPRRLALASMRTADRCRCASGAAAYCPVFRAPFVAM